jgi:FADH2 O2-dependent halogenase
VSEIHDLAVIGSGFAGSLLAMTAIRQGRSVLLIERCRHPRHAIGESSTPLSNLLLEEIATRYDLPDLLPLSKWGSWQKHYPDVACGLKRGFSFFHHDLSDGKQRCAIEDQLLVAASPHDAVADTHWYRADFDQLLVQKAQRLGAAYHDEVLLSGFENAGDHIRLSGARRGQAATFRARLVVDATGPRGCLHHLLGLGESPLASYPATQALYTHFSGVKRLDGTGSFEANANAPYPIDDAAVHHIFDGGWVWVLRFNNGLVSAGIAATDEASERMGLREGAAAWGRLLDQIPALRTQFAEAEPVRQFTHLPRVAFQSSNVVGDRWALLPSAAGFVDPLLSTGFPLTLLGVSRLAAIFEQHWGESSLQSELQAYAALTEDELRATAGLIAALYANMRNFPVFRSLSLLYFAAASFSETARRLGNVQLAGSFLLQNDVRFGPSCRDLVERAKTEIAAKDSISFMKDVLHAIEPFDVAGLSKAPEDNCYPVDANDLKQAAWKVDSNAENIERMLARCGFVASVQ